MLDQADTEFVNEAAKRGIFAYLPGDPDQLQSALDIVLRRFAEYHNLEGAFGRRAMIERAKGILMAIHGIDEQQAFEMLRSHSQRNGRKLIDLAEAVVHSHRLLSASPPRAARPPTQRRLRRAQAGSASATRPSCATSRGTPGGTGPPELQPDRRLAERSGLRRVASMRPAHQA